MAICREKPVYLPPLESLGLDPLSDLPSLSSQGESLAKMTEDQAMIKITEDVKEFFTVRDLDEAEAYFTTLPAVHHFRLVDKLTSSAVEKKEADVQLVADLFSCAVSKKLVSSAAMDEGLVPITEMIEDIAIDAPKAYAFLSTIIKSTALAEERQTALALKSMASDELLPLLIYLFNFGKKQEAKQKEQEVRRQEEELMRK